jgi:sulfoquinovosyltransferase
MRLSDGNPDAPLLLYVGRLGKEKKINRIRRVLEAIPGCRLALVGHGPAEDSLKEYFRGFPVTFIGSLSGLDLSQAFASADVFVMPSDSETLGFVVLEALASGLVVVAVNAGGVPDIVVNEVTGYLVKNDDNVEEFIDRTRLLIEDKTRRAEMATNARKWAINWSWEAATSLLRNIHYPQAVANNKLHHVVDDVNDEDMLNYYRPDLAF